jgi:hypothetical protein
MTRRRYFVLGSASVGVLGEPLSMTPCPPSNSRITDFGLILRISATSDVVRNLGNARGSRRIGGSTRGARLCRRRACSCDAASTTEQSRIPPLTAPALTRHTWYTRLLITLQRFKVVPSGTPNLRICRRPCFAGGTRGGPSVWPPRFPSRSPKLIHLEKPTPKMAVLRRQSQRRTNHEGNTGASGITVCSS